jgi:iron(III) transport system permease protein
LSIALPLRISRYGVDIWSTSSFLFCLLVLCPVAVLTFGLFQPAEWWGHLAESLLTGYILNTVWLTAAVVVLALGMAVPTAWLVSQFEFPGRRGFEWLLVLPLAVPTYVAAFVYMDLQEQTFPLLIHIRSTYGVDTYLFAEAAVRKGLLSLLMAGVL